MKKAVLTIAAIGITVAGIAQDKFVSSAATALSQKALDEAKADIDKAMSSPETSGKPKALYVKAQVYFSLNQEPKYKSLNAYRDATQALLKLAEVKPDYEKEEVTGNLYYGACLYYNDGNAAFNDKKYSEANDYYQQVVKIHDMGGGKRWEKFSKGKPFDTVSAQAVLCQARVAYYQKNNEDAITLLNKVKSNPITKSADNYIILLETYDKYNSANSNKMSGAEMDAIQEARTAFPDNVNIRNMEMNAYLKYNKLTELQKKMEEALKNEPNNADVNFNLALLYLSLANPTEGAKPANATELFGKSETAFKKAVSLSPENATYAYNFGTLYYMQAYDVNEKMNAITGTSAAEMKKYDDLKKERDSFFGKATPNMEKANSILSAGTLKESDRETYRSCLIALKQMYTVNENKDKRAEVSAKLDALDK